MIKLAKLSLVASLLFSTSCAFLLNKKEVDLSLSSNPPGADIIIEGRNYGKTPKIIHIIPKNYDVELRIAGYGSSKLKLQTWQAIRSDKAEGGRCLADALGTMLVLPIFSYYSVYCRDFKVKDHLITIPQNESRNIRAIPNQEAMPIGSQIPFNPYPNPYQNHQQYNTYNPYNNPNNSIEPQIPSFNSQGNRQIIDSRYQNQAPDPFNRVGQNLYRDSYRENFDPKNATFDQNRAPKIPKEVMEILNKNQQMNQSEQNNSQHNIEEMYNQDMNQYYNQ